MARTDGAPCFEKRLLCSELRAGHLINVEGRYSRVIKVERCYKKVFRPGHQKPLVIHTGTEIYTDHPDYGYHQPSKTRTPGSKIAVRFWLRAETWDERRR